MFCNQCQETVQNKGCTKAGVCGKAAETSNLQDALLHATIGLATAASRLGDHTDKTVNLLYSGLFTTITNVNFDDNALETLIRQILAERDALTGKLSVKTEDILTWTPSTRGDMLRKAPEASFLSTEDPDIRSLKALLINGLKGTAAYAHHARALHEKNAELNKGMIRNLAALSRKDLGMDELFDLILNTGNLAVQAMAALDKAHTNHYGHQEITEVPTGTTAGHGILISGHDLKDLEELLLQTEGTGVNVYTHGEMLPANAYPLFKKYKHLAGHFGGAWWKQQDEFEHFSGTILFTTNCIQKPRESYQSRMFTTGLAAWPGCTHIQDRKDGQMKDFSPVIHASLQSEPLAEKRGEKLVIGFAHDQVLRLKDKVVDAVKSGAVKKFVVMAGCDGRHSSREYFTEIARQLPENTIILTAGCAKYRYNHLSLGDIGGIPRLLDAGQCNDSYSLAMIALALKDAFGLNDLNQLPIAFDIAWYEQKAVAVLLALLAMGFKNIRLGPTLPAFLSPAVTGVLVEKFGITPTGTIENDLAAIVG